MADNSMIIIAVGLPETTKLLIRSRLQPLALDFRTPHSSDEFRHMLKDRAITAGCIIVDSDTLDDKGLAVCTAVRAVNKTVPIVMLSSEQDKNYYIAAIRWGVSSFIFKPFKDDSIRIKLMEYYHAQGDKNAEMITFDLEKFILGEFRKAEKGHFSLSFMFATVHLNTPEEQGNVNHAYYLNLFYETIKRLFWDTDAFIRYNSNYCLGVFPFCAQKNIETLTNKINTAFNELHHTKHVPFYVEPVMVFATYPDDSEKFLEIQRMLADRVRMKMGDMKIEWFI